MLQSTYTSSYNQLILTLSHNFVHSATTISADCLNNHKQILLLAHFNKLIKFIQKAIKQDYDS